LVFGLSVFCRFRKSRFSVRHTIFAPHSLRSGFGRSLRQMILYFRFQVECTGCSCSARGLQKLMPNIALLLGLDLYIPVLSFGPCLVPLFALQSPRRFPLEPTARRIRSRCVCPTCRSAPGASCPFSGSHLECCSLHIASSDRFYRSSRELARSAEGVPSRRFLLNLAAILAQRAASFSSYHRSLLPHESLLVYTFVQVAHGGLQF
jgi:hypothetical protein